VATATANIAALRKELDTQRDDAPRHRELVAQMEAQYPLLHPIPAVEPGPAAQALGDDAQASQQDAADGGVGRRLGSQEPAADAAWAKPPKPEQAAWTRSRLRYHPNVVRFLAAVGERLKRARTGGLSMKSLRAPGGWFALALLRLHDAPPEWLVTSTHRAAHSRCHVGLSRISRVCADRVGRPARSRCPAHGSAPDEAL
jgi:hypothetical protein